MSKLTLTEAVKVIPVSESTLRRDLIVKHENKLTLHDNVVRS